MAQYPVLVAEPTPEALEAMRDALQEIGLTVKTADTLEEVRRNLAAEAFALVLISGHEFYSTGTEHLLSTFDGIDPAPELLLVADDDDLDVATSLLERGTGDYLARPFTSNQLVAAVETGVVRFEVRQERAELEGQLDDVRRRFDEASDRQSQLVRSIDEKRDRILDELEEENKELRKKLQSAIQESSRDAAERLSLVEDRLQDTQKECDRLHEESERLTEQLRIEREDRDKSLSEVQAELGEARRLLEESQRKQERQEADFESKSRGLEEQAELDRRESRSQIRHLEETRDALTSQVEDLLGELTQAREARREAEEERRKVKDELMEEVGRLSEDLQVQASDSETYQRRHEDLERVHAESSETARARIIELETERDTAKEEARRSKDNAERVRIRLERHLESKNTELRAMAEERNVLRSRIKNLDDDLRRFAQEVAGKEEERDGLLRDLEGRARRAEKEAREADVARQRAEERHRTALQDHERKITDREREVKRLARENGRLSEYLRTERANLTTRLEASERRIQSLTQAKNMLNDEFGKRLEDQTGRLERLSRDHERIAAEHRQVVDRLEAEVRTLREALGTRESDLEAVVLERERLDRQVHEKDRLIGQLTLESRELRKLLGREADMPGLPAALEGTPDDLAPDPAALAVDDIPPDPGVAPEARPEPIGAAITQEEYDALRGGWGELDLPPEDAADDAGGGLPPGFADLPDEDADLLPDEDALAIQTMAPAVPEGGDDDDQLPPGFSPSSPLVDA